MAKANPVNEAPAVTTATSAPPVKASDKPRNDDRRPASVPETTKDKPKNTYNLPDGTKVEDY